MSIENRIERLEEAAIKRRVKEFDFTLLTDAELLALDACYRKAEETGAPVHQCITPEAEAVIQRIWNTPRA